LQVSTNQNLQISSKRWLLLAILFLVSMSSYMDRNIISVLIEPIKNEFEVSDTLLGLLGGAAFSIFYAVLGIPVAKWADSGDRKFIISLAVGIWSLMTILCGFAQTFLMLAIARVGVGIGESGAIPPSQSLLVDYFSNEERTKAIAIFTAASTLGTFVGFVGGGYVAAHEGWRQAFILAGIPGLVIALLCWIFLIEPRKYKYEEKSILVVEKNQSHLKTLLRKSSYVYILASLGLAAFYGYGTFVFVPSFASRVLQATSHEISVVYGLSSSATTLIGTLSGGFIAQSLMKKDPRWLMWLPSIFLLIAAPLYFCAFSSTDFYEFIAWCSLAQIFFTASLPVLFSAAHLVCGNARRAYSISLVMFSMSLIGTALGPFVTGLLSDLLATTEGVNSIGHAILIMNTSLIAASFCAYAGSRSLNQDCEP
jgi:MFS family permease